MSGLLRVAACRYLRGLTAAASSPPRLDDDETSYRRPAVRVRTHLLPIVAVTHGSKEQAVNIIDLFWLTDAQMARPTPFFQNSYGKPRLDDLRVLSGIIFIKRDGLRWPDAPAAYGPHATF